jgi:hypothetical protein
LSKPAASAWLHRVERCWFRLLSIVMVVGPALAATGVGATLLGLAVFLAIFVAAATLVIHRELGPAVSLSSSADRGDRNFRGLTSHL